MKTKTQIHTRWMIKRDMDEVCEIERLSYSEPWTAENFDEILVKRNAVPMVAERGEKIVGFMIYELHKKHLHIINVAVHPDFRLQRVGHAMIAGKMASKLSAAERTCISVDLHECNVEAHLFFQRCGFRAVEILRRHYDSGDDGYRMEYRIAPDLIECATNRIGNYLEDA